MFFNSYFSDYNNEMIGGGKCSICNEAYTNHNTRGQK